MNGLFRDDVAFFDIRIRKMVRRCYDSRFARFFLLLEGMNKLGALGSRAVDRSVCRDRRVLPLDITRASASIVGDFVVLSARERRGS